MHFRKVQMGVPQGSILGPLLFILYINDIVNLHVECETFLYADDTAIFFKSTDCPELHHKIANSLPKISQWLHSNLLSLNESKTVYQVYNNHKTDIGLQIKFNGISILHQNPVKYLGVYVDENLKFASHISSVSNMISRNIGMI